MTEKRRPTILARLKELQRHPLPLPRAITVRPPILHATSALGVTDAEVARQLGVHSVQVSDWALGKRPIPRVRHVAIQLLVARLLVALDMTPYSKDLEGRRRQVVRDVATQWLRLSQEELGAVSDDVTDEARALLDRVPGEEAAA